MKRLVVFALLAGCSAPTIEIVDAPTPTPTARVESFDPALRFHFDALRRVRAANAADSIANTPDDVDVLCLHEVRFAEDREAILARARARWPYIGFVATDARTPIEDPRDYRGVSQSVDLGVACADPVDVARLDAQVACVTETCVGAGGALDIECAIASCTDLPRPTAPRCSACYESLFGATPLSDAHRRCAEAPRGELNDGGQLAAVILSRHPLSEVSAHMFPASTSPRGALTARVEAQRPYHVACLSLLAFVSSGPYPGVFAPNDLQGYQTESWLVLSRAIDLARGLGARGPTVVLGGQLQLWSTSKKGQSAVTLEWDWLRLNLQPFVSPGTLSEAGTALCTGCFRENPIVPLARYAADVNAWSELLFGSGASFVVHEVGVTRTERAYTINGQLMPVGPFYGARATLSW